MVDWERGILDERLSVLDSRATPVDEAQWRPYKHARAIEKYSVEAGDSRGSSLGEVQRPLRRDRDDRA